VVWSLCIRDKSPWYPLDRRLGGPQSRSGHGLESNHGRPAGNPRLLNDSAGVAGNPTPVVFILCCAAYSGTSCVPGTQVINVFSVVTL